MSKFLSENNINFSKSFIIDYFTIKDKEKFFPNVNNIEILKEKDKIIKQNLVNDITNQKFNYDYLNFILKNINLYKQFKTLLEIQEIFDILEPTLSDYQILNFSNLKEKNNLINNNLNIIPSDSKFIIKFLIYLNEIEDIYNFQIKFKLINFYYYNLKLYNNNLKIRYIYYKLFIYINDCINNKNEFFYYFKNGKKKLKKFLNEYINIFKKKEKIFYNEIEYFFIVFTKYIFTKPIQLNNKKIIFITNILKNNVQNNLIRKNINFFENLDEKLNKEILLNNSLNILYAKPIFEEYSNEFNNFITNTIFKNFINNNNNKFKIQYIPLYNNITFKGYYDNILGILYIGIFCCNDVIYNVFEETEEIFMYKLIYIGKTILTILNTIFHGKDCNYNYFNNNDDIYYKNYIQKFEKILDENEYNYLDSYNENSIFNDENNNLEINDLYLNDTNNLNFLQICFLLDYQAYNMHPKTFKYIFNSLYDNYSNTYSFYKENFKGKILQKIFNDYNIQLNNKSFINKIINLKKKY